MPHQRAIGVVPEKRSKPQTPNDIISPGHGELSIGMMIWSLRTRDTYKSLRAETKSFSSVEQIFK
jgi:hypothetical protein